MAKAEKTAHTDQFTRTVRDRLIDAWEKMGGHTKVREWPKYNKINPRTGENELYKYQAHHIIPQQVKGSHSWWNMHPAHPNVHQSVIHGSGSRLLEILRTLPQGVK